MEASCLFSINIGSSCRYNMRWQTDVVFICTCSVLLPWCTGTDSTFMLMASILVCILMIHLLKRWHDKMSVGLGAQLGCLWPVILHFFVFLAVGVREPSDRSQRTDWYCQCKTSNLTQLYYFIWINQLIDRYVLIVFFFSYEMTVAPGVWSSYYYMGRGSARLIACHGPQSTAVFKRNCEVTHVHCASTLDTSQFACSVLPKFWKDISEWG